MAILKLCHERNVKNSVVFNPEGAPPSIDDFRKAYENGYEVGLALGHNGQVYEYTNKKVKISVEDADNIHSNIVQYLNGGMDIDRAHKMVYNENMIDYRIL